MKTTVVLSLALLAVTSSAAQALRPQAVNGALLGGVAGAIIGHNSGDLRHNAWRGAAYGAGAGLLIGSIVGDAHDRRFATRVPRPDYPRAYIYRHAPSYYGYGYYGRPSHYYRRGGDFGYVSYEAPLYADDYYGGGDYASNGLLLGALAGAVIGNNSGGLRHNAWRGAAYGAATGYILGSIAESNARRYQYQNANASPVIATVASNQNGDATTATSYDPEPQPAAPAAPAAPASSMSAANSLFGRK